MNTKRIPIAIIVISFACVALAYGIGSLRPFAPSTKFSGAVSTVAAQAPIASQTPSNTPTATQAPLVSPQITDVPPTGTDTATSPATTQTGTPPATATIETGIPTTTAATASETPTVLRSLSPESESAAATQTSIPAQKTFDAISTRAHSTVTVKPTLARAISATTNFLLVGTDTRVGDANWQPNTDVMMVLFLDSTNQRAALLSLPRDLVVAIPGQQAFRINSAYHLGFQKDGVAGGVKLLEQILRDDLDIRVDHWALIDFNGLNRIVDTLGGIEVDVPCALTDTIDEQTFTIPAGSVHMDYVAAKRYLQSRYTTSDTSRNYRQQRVVWAMAKKALSLNAPDRVPLLYDQLKESIATDMNLFDMLGLVPAMYQLDLLNHPERLRAQVLEAPAVYPWISSSGAWLYMPNYDVIQGELDRVFDAPQVASAQPTQGECPVVASTPHPTDAPAAVATPPITQVLTDASTPAVSNAAPPAEATPAVPTPAPTPAVSNAASDGTAAINVPTPVSAEAPTDDAATPTTDAPTATSTP